MTTSMAEQGLGDLTCILSGVEETKNVLGYGSFATVLELDYLGLKCAGKKINQIHLGQEDYNCRFIGACQLLRKVHHPNIVQFLGVYLHPDDQLPILVMEKLPINLTDCIQKCGVLPGEISYSILQGVALGLHFLHSQNTPIIHRNLSSNNVLLTENMTAKVADVGVAEILNLTRLHVSQTPCVSAYMPPEVLVARPTYRESTDIFSFGILMMHLFSGQLPEPLEGQTRFENEVVVINTEEERRKIYLQDISHEHPMRNLMLRCIDTNPNTRPSTTDIINHDVFTQQIIVSFGDHLAQLRNSIVDSENVRSQKDKEISNLEQECSSLGMHIEQLDIQISQLEEEVTSVRQKKDNINKLNEDLQTILQDCSDKSKAISEENEKFADTLEQLASVKGNIEQIEVKETDELNVRSSTHCNKYAVAASVVAVVLLAILVISGIQYFENRCTNKMGVLNRTWEQQLILPGKQIHVHHSKSLDIKILWENCADLPVEMSEGQSTVINGTVYFGGGSVSDERKRYLVYKYDPSVNQWSSLPPLPVRSYGIGQVSGKLVAIGGVKKMTNKETNDVFTFNEESSSWEQTSPTMSMTRFSPGVLSHQSVLVVVGGSRSAGHAVEIFKSDTSKWYTTNDGPIPVKCYGLSTVIVNGACCVLGGSINISRSNHGYHAPLADLLHSPSSTRSSKKKSIWKALPDTPTYQPTAAVLAGNLLTIGGSENKDGGLARKEVYMYSALTKSWIHISDLPSPRSLTAAAPLSSTEILVIGGYNHGRVKSVYKGTLV